MELTTSTKKIALAAILTSGLALAISQSALAQPGNPQTPGAGMGSMSQQVDPATQKTHEKFLADTVDLRKQMAEKHAMMRALMNAGTPDTVKAGQLAGELFDLREKLRVKAQEAGLPYPMMGAGCGMGDGMGMGMGMGMGHRNR
jgi:zinc resistance-associated protein